MSRTYRNSFVKRVPELDTPFGLDRPRVITIRWASGELPTSQLL
jgi:hypothetical protein